MSAIGPASSVARAGKAALVVGAAIAVLASGIVVCPVAMVARHPCPACGLTRASFALARLDLDAALALHPMVVVVTPLLGAWAAAAAYGYVISGRAWPSPRASRVFAFAFPLVLAALLGVWIARFYGAFGGPVAVG